MPTTADEFLRWNEGREGKREFVRGRVVEMMIDTTRNHFRIATNLLVTLRRLLAMEFDVGSAEFGIRTPGGVRYPDAFVDRVGPKATGDDLAAIDPLLVVEILSPSSYTRDFGERLSDYAAITSLLHYIIVAQDEARMWIWSRTTDGKWSGPLLVAGMDQTAEISGLNLSIGLADVYLGVFDRNAN